MVEYNTAMPKLKMREYGRNIQKLINHCMTIEDREERNKCAYSIAQVMVKLFPDLNGEDLNNPKVWDHINAMSDFKLDIDFPCNVHSEADMQPAPEKLPYSRKMDKYRVYGENLVRMIKEISRMEGGIEKDRLIFLVANQMKKLLVNVNTDSATDRRVFNDIKEISGGGIDINAETYRLNEYIGVANPQDSKKKKKK